VEYSFEVYVDETVQQLDITELGKITI